MQSATVLAVLILLVSLTATEAATSSSSSSSSSSSMRPKAPDIVGSAVTAAPMRSVSSSERLEQLMELEKIAVKGFLDHVAAALENPKVELLIATIALSCAVYELVQDFEKVGVHHSLALISSVKVIKLVLSILKESKNASKTLSKTIHIKKLN